MMKIYSLLNNRNWMFRLGVKFPLKSQGNYVSKFTVT